MEPTFRRLKTALGLTVQRIEDDKVVKAVTYSDGKFPYYHFPQQHIPDLGCQALDKQYYCEMYPITDKSVRDNLQQQTTEEQLYVALEKLLTHNKQDTA